MARITANESTLRMGAWAALARRHPRAASYGGALGLGVAMYLLASPFLAVGHQLMVLGAARLLGGLTWLAGAGGFIRLLPADPIYTSAMLLTLGGIQTRGLAVAGPLGESLAHLAPGLFQPPELLASGAWASAVVEPGATVISRGLCTLVAEATLLAIGVLAVRRGLRSRPWLAIAGAAVQAHVIVNHLIDSPPELREVEAAGLPFALAMILSGDVQAGPRLAERLGELPEPVRDSVLGLGAALLAYVPILVLLAAPHVFRFVRRLRRRLPEHRFGSRLWQGGSRLSTGALLGHRLGLAGLALAIAISPLGDLTDAETHYLAAPPEPAHEEVVSAGQQALTMEASAPVVPTAPTATETPAPTAPQSTTPSVVAVTGAGYQYTYTVNGVARVIRGMGYNVQYRDLDEAERARRLNRDFAALRKAGINTIFGWEPREFDMLLMDTAHAHRLGVAPPFELSPDEDYADPAVRARITAEVVAWVEQYRAHPALRMWAIGNEVLHKVVYPSWMPVRSAPEWEARARAFSRFYVDLIDRIHLIDPDHPIVHRDAEDAYLTWLRDAMADGRQRPWFVYGINSYTPRLSEILVNWPSHQWDVALLVSEFAPGGMGPGDRPQGFRSMWQSVRAANRLVLGGSVYAWTTNGPEEVDRVFGLVDGDGRPVDRSLSALAGLFKGEERQSGAVPVGAAEPREGRIWTLTREAIRSIQSGRARELLPPEAVSSIMGNVNDVSREPARDADVQLLRVRDPDRLAWEQSAGVQAEWWATWKPASTPQHQLTFLIQERSDGTLQIGYIYHGPR